MKKKIIGISIAIFLLVFFSKGITYASETEVYVNKNGLEISTNEYNNLLSLSFSKEEIHNMTEDEYFLNYNVSGTVVSSDTKYIETIYRYSTNNNIDLENIQPDDSYNLISVTNNELTEAEYNSIPTNIDTIIVELGDNNPVVVETTYKKLTTTIISLSSGGYRFRNDLLWKRIPSTRSYDIFVIGLNNATNEPISGSQYARTTYTMKDMCTMEIANYSRSDTNWKYSPNGYGLSLKVPSDTKMNYSWNTFLEVPYPCQDGALLPGLSGNKDFDVKLNSLSSYMYFNVAKVGNGTPLSAYGSYQHSVESIPLNLSLSFGIDIGGNLGGTISISPSYVSKFDGMSGTHAQLLNPTNW